MPIFLQSILKVAAAIFIAAAVLLIIWAAIWKVLDYNKKQEASVFEVVKEWHVDLKTVLQMSLKARTKLVDDKLLCAVSFTGYPAFLSDPKLATRNRDGNFTINFSDKDGFKLEQKVIPLKDMTQSVDRAGKPMGLEYQFSEYMPVDTYKRIAVLDVQWTFETQMPSATAHVPISDARTQDHCGPGLTKPERLRRLSAHGVLRETGYNSYSAGESSITFIDGGGVLLCN